MPKAKKKISRNKAVLDRMEIIIEGITDRTVSSLETFVKKLKVSGLGQEAINKRIRQEFEEGPTFSELRKFATAQVPGFTGDLLYRFGGDTLTDEEQKRIIQEDKEEFISFLEERTKEFDELSEGIKERIGETFQKEGIDTSSLETDSKMNPPPEADLDQRYRWLTMHDEKVCSICGDNHNKVKTLREWVDIGEPRSGACLGDQNCRCILIPENAISKKDQDQLKDLEKLK